jgi:hypothetical protein
MAYGFSVSTKDYSESNCTTMRAEATAAESAAENKLADRK